MAASRRGSGERVQLAADSDDWGSVTLRVLGGTVHFQADVPASNEQTYLVTGWFGLGCRAGKSGVENVQCLTGGDDPIASARIAQAAEGGLIPDMVELWEELDPQDHLELLEQDARLWLQHKAAQAYLDDPDAPEADAQADLREAHCRFAAYSAPGELGATARRLVEDGWGGSADELISTAATIVGTVG